MPNWCYNNITVKHEDASKIAEIKTELEKEDSQLFNLIRPNPAGEWQYDWSIENWGSKWDAQVGDHDLEDDNTIRIMFDTAWSPPIALYEYMTQLGYEVDAFYIEEGMAFAGHFHDGYDEYYEYSHLTADEVQDQLGDIDEFWNISERMREQESEQAYEEWTEMCSELERTDWFPAKIKPNTVGVYETQCKAWPYPAKSYWDGEKWCFYDWYTNTPNGELYNKPKQWRGITEAQNTLCELTSELHEMMESENI